MNNKKAVVVGGSNGLGLAIGSLLSNQGYFLEICDRVPPESGILSLDSFDYHYCDLRYFDEALFKTLSLDPNVSVLVVTAGVGRVADFEYHHLAEIEKILTINTLSTIKIFSCFYDLIKSKNEFFSCVLCSIAGRISSPAASVYAASKAAIVRFVESINIELESSGTNNRVLDVSPASFKGSRFYGENNNLPLITPLAISIIKKMFLRNTVYIPQYDEILKNVLAQYHSDPHAYGLYSYNFKKNSGRLDNTQHVDIGYMSGTFDLFHIGHLNIIKKAKSQCDCLVVGVHFSGKRKGKETFIPFAERKAIVASCKFVDYVVDALPEDTDIWPELQYNKLFVGSDYKGTERFKRYENFFANTNVKIIYFPYTEGTSSTQLRENILGS